MIVDFYCYFDDVEFLVFQEVFNGVWDVFFDGCVELVIGVICVILVGGCYVFWDMGMLSWSCVVVSYYLLVLMDGLFSDDMLCNWLLLVCEDIL